MLTELKLSDIKPYPGNPRDNSGAIESVRQSIERYGYINPIVVDGDNVILAGHTRYEAIKLLGWKKVKVVKKTDLTEDKAKVYRIADNKVGELSGWDRGKLTQEIREINQDLLVSDLFPNINAQLKALDFDDKDFEGALGLVKDRYTAGNVELVKVDCQKCGHGFRVAKVQ